MERHDLDIAQHMAYAHDTYIRSICIILTYSPIHFTIRIPEFSHSLYSTFAIPSSRPFITYATSPMLSVSSLPPPSLSSSPRSPSQPTKPTASESTTRKILSSSPPKAAHSSPNRPIRAQESRFSCPLHANLQLLFCRYEYVCTVHFCSHGPRTAGLGAPPCSSSVHARLILGRRQPASCRHIFAHLAPSSSSSSSSALLAEETRDSEGCTFGVLRRGCGPRASWQDFTGVRYRRLVGKRKGKREKRRGKGGKDKQNMLLNGKYVLS